MLTLYLASWMATSRIPTVPEPLSLMPGPCVETKYQSSDATKDGEITTHRIHRVRMCSQHKHVVRIAAFGLRNNVISIRQLSGFCLILRFGASRSAVFANRNHIDICSQRPVSRKLILQGRSICQGDARSRNQRAFRTYFGTQSTSKTRFINVVVYHGGDSTCSPCESGLETELAGATGDEGDVAGEGGWVIGLDGLSTLKLG